MKEIDGESGAAVVLIHGLTGAPPEIKSLERALRANGHHVECPLLPGHGGDNKELLRFTKDDWVAAVSQRIEILSQSYEWVYVAGLCASAAISIVTAANNKSVSGIILISTHYGQYSKHAPPQHRLLPLVTQFATLNKTLYWTEQPPYGVKDERVVKMIEAAVRNTKGQKTNHGTFRTYVGTLHEAERLSKQARECAHQVVCPALIFHSLEDTWFAPQNATDVYRDLQSDDKCVVLLTNCDHVLTLDLQKEAIARKVCAFISERAKMVEAVAGNRTLQ